MASKLVRLSVENFMRIKTAEVRPDGAVILVGGKNAQGKSALLNAIEAVIAGARSIPKEPLRKGADKGRIVAELDDPPIIITRTIDGGQNALAVTARDGARYSTPQAILEALYNGLTIDPLGFVRMPPAKQADTLRELSGLDFTEHDAKREALYNERRDVNRDAKAAKARRDAATQYEGVELIEIGALVDEVHAIEDRNRKRADKRNELAALKTAIVECDERILELEHQLKEELNNREILGSKITNAANVDADEDAGPLREKLATAEDNNAKVRANATHEQLQIEYNDLQHKSQALTESIEALDKAKADALAGAKLPIDGLAFDATGVRYNGAPFEQCSQAEKIRVSVAMGVAANPRLKILLVREASLLDEDNRKLLATLAAEHDAQLWLEVAEDGPHCAVVMVDGVAMAPLQGGE